MVFVDAQNLERTAAYHYDEEYAVDYEALLDLLVDGRELVRPYCFDSHDPDDDKADFYRFLRRELGFRVVSEPLQTDGHPEEKGVDVALATELIAQAHQNSYDVAVLVSGDADYTHAVRHVQDRGEVVEGAAFAGATATRILDLVDDFHPLNEVDERIRRE